MEKSMNPNGTGNSNFYNSYSFSNNIRTIKIIINGLDSNVTQLLANLLTKPCVSYYLPIVSCNLVSIKLLLLYYYYN